MKIGQLLLKDQVSLNDVSEALTIQEAKMNVKHFLCKIPKNKIIALVDTIGELSIESLQKKILKHRVQ